VSRGKCRKVEALPRHHRLGVHAGVYIHHSDGTLVMRHYNKLSIHECTGSLFQVINSEQYYDRVLSFSLAPLFRLLILVRSFHYPNIRVNVREHYRQVARFSHFDNVSTPNTISRRQHLLYSIICTYYIVYH
jgi:hypothetical protein